MFLMLVYVNTYINPDAHSKSHDWMLNRKEILSVLLHILLIFRQGAHNHVL